VNVFVVTVKIQVKPEGVADFLEAMLDNARNTRLEPGNLRFDVLRSNEDPTKFFLYEVYKTADDHKSHGTTAHYLRWRDRVNPLMAVPRVGERYTEVFPTPYA
jgi:autoinducer 2-degrading protein